MFNASVANPSMPGKDYVAMRLRNFGVSIIVMVVCFTLYYLGMFGGVEGPLEGKRLGETLLYYGLNQYHLLAVFLVLLAVAVSWNWIINYAARVRGTRLTCIRTSEEDGIQHVCGAEAKRIRQPGKNGRTEIRYQCAKGHVLREARFHAVKKTAVTHTLWMIAATWCAMLVYFIWK